MTLKLHEAGLAKARALIDAQHYVRDSAWSDAQPTADDENAKVDRDGYEGFGEWHLGVDTDAGEGTKGRYKYPFGDFRRLHRSALTAAAQRAGEWGHREIKDAAEDLLSRIPD